MYNGLTNSLKNKMYCNFHTNINEISRTVQFFLMDDFFNYWPKTRNP